ncbi:MAG: LacI family DNA-binding transcriptional regulator [Pseudomonadota bacterium]
MAQRVTIKTIAEDLGVSHMTVSRALANHPNVNAKTRQQVLKRASDLGYVKSAAATAMRGDATGIVGLLLPNIVNEFYARFANALAIACDDRALSLIIHLTDDDAAREHQAVRRLRGVQADSVIMVPSPKADQDEELHLDDLKVVQFIRRRQEASPTSGLLVEDKKAIASAVDQLFAKGHTKIAYIGASKSLTSGATRLSAFEEAMARNGLACNPELIRTGTPSFDLGCQSARSILETRTQASALVCGGFEISNGALDTCLRQGLKMPDDIAFIGYGDPASYMWINGGISTISLPVELLAEHALDIVSSNRQPYDGKPEDRFVAASLVLRSSA